MVYNFNLGIGWASSGVEYAQAYRAKMFRNINEPARFIFTDMFPTENIEHFTRNIGFKDDEVIWLYSFFTDFKTEPVTFTLDDLIRTIPEEAGEWTMNREGKIGRIIFGGKNNFLTLYFTDEDSDLVHRVEVVSGGFLIRKDYYTSAKLYSEYYAPLDGRAHLYLRRFFNTDGSLAYEEVKDGDDESMFRFSDNIFYSKVELVGYLVRSLGLTEKDLLIIDRTTDIGQVILENSSPARTAIVIHADHYSKNNTDDSYILWNNYYEYPFDMADHIDFYITSTDMERHLLKEQFRHYTGKNVNVVTIPAGGLDRLCRPVRKRKPFSIVTASRLANEKHIDWIVNAVKEAKKDLPELTLDIYGQGENYKLLKRLIGKDDYIRLMGQHDMTLIYRDYELYLAGSTSEGFGLSLMEAVGSGLPIIGFDVPYGNPTFVDEGKNGYLIPFRDSDTDEDRINRLASAVVRYFKESDMEKFHEHSYEKASDYLVDNLSGRWKEILN